MVGGSTIWKPSQTVVLTFDGQMLPQRVFLCYNALSIEVYTYPTIQCYNWCRYGHTKAQCRSRPRCFKRTNAHISESCTVREDEVSCLHCLGRHTTTRKLCPELDRQKRIKISMAEESISYSETSKKHPAIGKSYVNATASSLSNPSAQKSKLPNSSSSNRKTSS
ncbi:hypothetical protein EVAR_88736_1 [Eumeta japonica]|uniref:Nucleic-acid-binding protein from transposon X-element n=1 Tax=Eumeta variegata TaxID=151549 RepID=A0A4C1XFR1_EUMVA|nr:hypothetical protein EVAR_88736_1 [Eumeta japonica]